MIQKTVLCEYRSLPMGHQVNINHDDCSAGRDSKKRLYIKRVVGGVVAYCHHCSDHGFWRELNTDGATLRKWLFNDIDDMPRVGIKDSKYLSRKSITSPEIINWLFNCYILSDDEQIKKFFAQADKDLALTLFNTHGDNIGYQYRNFSGSGPKYTTHYFTGLKTNDTASWFITKNKHCHYNLFITEDYTSAYRIFRDTGEHALALLRTSISNDTIAEIEKLNPRRIYVWLDNDEAGKKASSKIISRLRYCLPMAVAEMSCEHKEPKEISPTTLRRFRGL